MKAMLLAAGEGTRLRPFTLQLPKPAIPFLGVPLADHGIRLLTELGPCDLVVNHHHLSDDIHRLFHRSQMQSYKVEFSDESSSLLGSGGAVHKASAFLKDEKNFVVMNGDEVILPHRSGQIREAYESHVGSGRLATMIVIDHPEVGQKFGGAWATADEEIRQFSKSPVPLLKGWHYIGIIFLSNRVFSFFKSDVVEENLLYETLTLAIAKGESVVVHPIAAEWFETGNPFDFRLATETCLDELLKDRPAPWALDLQNFLATQKTQGPLVEASDALLIQKMDRVQRKIKGR